MTLLRARLEIVWTLRLLPCPDGSTFGVHASVHHGALSSPLRYGRSSSFLLTVGHQQVQAVVGMLSAEMGDRLRPKPAPGAAPGAVPPTPLPAP